MKIWKGYGSEHSANLVLIGNFADATKAQDALTLINDLTAIARADEQSGQLTPGQVPTSFSPAVLNFAVSKNLSLSYADPEQLLYDFDAQQSGDKVVVTTEESEINAFVKLMLHEGGRVEVYSAHEHGGPYGR